MQHGLTKTQNAIYDHLWQIGAGEAGKESVIAPAGWHTLARALRMSDKGIKLNVRNLVAKRVLDLYKEEDRHANTPRLYRVWNYKVILQRWKAEGWSYVRTNSGVHFLTPQEVAHYAGQGRLPVPRPSRAKAPREVETSIGVESSIGEGTSTPPRVDSSTVPREVTTAGPVEASSMPPVEDTSTTPKLESSTTENTSSSASELATIAQELALHVDLIGTTDDDYAVRLLERCRKRAPDAPVGLICWIIKTKVRKAARDGIGDPGAYLATSVEGMFSGVSYAIALQEWTRSEQALAESRERAESQRHIAELEYQYTLWYDAEQKRLWEATSDAIRDEMRRVAEKESGDRIRGMSYFQRRQVIDSLAEHLLAKSQLPDLETWIQVRGRAILLKQVHL